MKKILSIVLALAVSTTVQAAGDILLGRSKANRCAPCHGADGISLHHRFPDLAGRDENYLIEQLKAFRNDTRIDSLGLCNPIAKTLSDKDIEDLAAYYSSLPTAQAAGDILLGRSKANRCAACHGADGISLHRRFPNLAGQDGKFLIEQLKAFRNDTRIDPLGLCNPIAKTLSDKDIEDLAAYYSTLPATGDLRERLKRGK